MKERLELERAFFTTAPALLELQSARRLRLPPEWGDSLLDLFPDTGAACLFLSLPPGALPQLGLSGRYGLTPCPAGGWWLRPHEDRLPTYWLPVPPAFRHMDGLGRIFADYQATLEGFDTRGDRTRVTFADPGDGTRLQVCLWRLPEELVQELETSAPLETQGWFSLGSHSTWQRPADLFTHMEQGWIHENRRSWPHRCRICSENDAHALYMICAGLGEATRKDIYRIFQAQILLAVIHRQDERGGWRHGEWSDDESHFRLVTSALHLLMDAWAATGDPRIGEAMTAAARFLGERAGRIRFGTWFPHDELELSEEGISRLPFRWIRSRALGKTESNLLVLNTHLDTSVALNRHAALSGLPDHRGAVTSALDSTRELLALAPLEPLYRLLFLPLRLTLLPKERAAALPLPLRALKRLGWKYIAPNLYRLKARFPRLVMPGGYIERDLCMGNWSFFYLTINLMDLARHRLAFPDEDIDEVIRRAEDFTTGSGVLDRWAELDYERHALGFWAEALYYLWRLEPSTAHSQRLADAIWRLEHLEMGLPPSLLGANGEVVGPNQIFPCPSDLQPGLRVANLGDRRRPRLLVVNCSAQELDPDPALTSWRPLDGTRGRLPPKAWCLLGPDPSVQEDEA